MRRYTSLSEIGEAENISKSYVSRILRLALLAPDIIEAILAGKSGPVADAGEAGAAAAGELGRAAPAILLSPLLEQRGLRPGSTTTRLQSPKMEASPARSLSLAMAASSGTGPISSAAWRTSGKRFTSPTEFKNSVGRASTQ